MLSAAINLGKLEADQKSAALIEKGKHIEAADDYKLKAEEKILNSNKKNLTPS